MAVRALGAVVGAPMFWRVASGSVSSSVEAILSRDSFTLEQLLADDELVKVYFFLF